MSKRAGSWTCLLALVWALTGSWLGHTLVPHCTGGVCHTPDDGAPAVVATGTSPEERDVCLACHLLRCLQTASASAVATLPVLDARQGLRAEAAPAASLPACIQGSARAPPAS